MKHLFSPLRQAPRALRRFGLWTVAALVSLTSCLDDDSLEQDDTQWGNFLACWQAMDQHYCFFEEKGVDWDSVYDCYRPYFADSTLNVVQQFSLMGRMLASVRDGHVNLYSSFNTARYWAWYEDYPDNYDDNLVMNYYLGTNYWLVAGMKYGMFSDSVGYIRYESFATTPGETNLDYVLSALSHAKGLIVDIRNNGGGALTNVPRIASRFVTGKTLYGYMRHKTGTGHTDFSDPTPLYLEPPTEANRILWRTDRAPVVVLVNRQTFSAANTFVAAMRAVAAHDGAAVYIVGDRTGGGGGMPFSTVLPNGWTLRFSASPMSDYADRSIEDGMDPDLHVDLDSLAAYEQHRDDIIEAGRRYVREHTRMRGDSMVAVQVVR
jgi:hypothetical protein